MLLITKDLVTIEVGTVMGPLLFLAYINDLPEATSSSARLFADDCLLFRRIRKIQDAVDLQNDLSSLELRRMGEKMANVFPS
jgi:hypothetical protein